MKNHLLLSLLLSLVGVMHGNAQSILYPPVIGGVTDSSARIIFFTAEDENYTLQVSTDSMFTNPRIFKGHTEEKYHNRALVNLTKLTPAMHYYYRIMIRNEADKYHGEFTTFPEVGTRTHLVIATGSCQETKNMKVFDAIPKHHPDIFIHLGDWTYPSYQVKGYPHSDSSVWKGWENRYTEKVMRDMLPYTVTDYMSDDDDGIGGSAHNENTKTTYRIDSVHYNRVVNYFVADTIMPDVRRRVIKAYADFYPGYPLVDTTIGIYHSFVMGNAEFFVIDQRNDSRFMNDAFVYDSEKNHWTFAPKPDHKIISDKQMAWLKEGLKNSKADWKFIVMGMPFNKNMEHLIKMGMHFQDFVVAGGGEKGTGFRLAASFSHYWPGYPASQKELLDFIHGNNIKDIIVLSGDTHHNVMDDGSNGGLPEVNASGLSVTGTILAHYMNIIGRVGGYPNIKKWLWNGGGNGIDNENYKNAFGKVDIYGADSVRLSIVDEDNLVISSIELPHSSKVAAGVKPAKKPFYMHRVERISHKKTPTGRIRFVKWVGGIYFKYKKSK